MPHPFDRFHSVPDYEHLLDIVEEIDLLEVFNPRVALTSFNEEAVRFAAQVPDRLRRRLRQPRRPGARQRARSGSTTSTGRPSSSRRCADADITRKHKNLVYVQTLKFLQTTGRPKAPKRRVPDAKPVRGGRPRRRGEAAAGEQVLMQAAVAKEPRPPRQRDRPDALAPTTRSARSTWSGRSASSTR